MVKKDLLPFNCELFIHWAPGAIVQQSEDGLNNQTFCVTINVFDREVLDGGVLTLIKANLQGLPFCFIPSGQKASHVGTELHVGREPSIFGILCKGQMPRVQVKPFAGTTWYISALWPRDSRDALRDLWYRTVSSHHLSLKRVEFKHAPKPIAQDKTAGLAKLKRIVMIPVPHPLTQVHLVAHLPKKVLWKSFGVCRKLFRKCLIKRGHDLVLHACTLHCLAANNNDHTTSHIYKALKHPWFSQEEALCSTLTSALTSVLTSSLLASILTSSRVIGARDCVTF